MGLLLLNLLLLSGYSAGLLLQVDPTGITEQLSEAKSIQQIMAVFISILVGVIIYLDRAKSRMITEERERHLEDRKVLRDEIEAKDKQIEELQKEVRTTLESMMKSQKEYTDKVEEVIMQNMTKLEELNVNSNRAMESFKNAIDEFKSMLLNK